MRIQSSRAAAVVLLCFGGAAACEGPRGPTGPQGPPGPPSPVEVYNSGNSSELVTRVRIGNGTGWEIGEIVYSLAVPDLRQGDTVMGVAEVEVTNDAGYNVLAPSTLILTDSPSKKPGDSPIFEISEANAHNVTPDMHHGWFTKAGSYTCLTNLGSMYINFCLRAGSTAAPTASPYDYLSIERDYGRLVVVVFRAPR